MPATLVVYKRMRQGVVGQNRERVEKITKIGGIWERVIALRAIPLSGRAKKTDAVVTADAVKAYVPVPPPPGMTPPPPPGRG